MLERDAFENERQSLVLSFHRNIRTTLDKTDFNMLHLKNRLEAGKLVDRWLHKGEELSYTLSMVLGL